MMNRIKQYVLVTLLVVPAMAQASQADTKHSAEKHYDLYGREVNKTEAISSLKSLYQERDAYAYQPTAKKKKKDTLNPLSAWYQNNKVIAGAVTGAALWGGLAAAAATFDSDLARTAKIEAVTTAAGLGALSGAFAGYFNGLGRLCAGSLIGCATGLMHHAYRETTASHTGIAVVGTMLGAGTGVLYQNTPGAIAGATVGMAGTCLAYGSIAAPVAYPVQVGAAIGSAIVSLHKREQKERKIIEELCSARTNSGASQGAHGKKDQTLSSHVVF